MPRAKRGEIWMADLGLAAKVRPVLVLVIGEEARLISLWRQQRGSRNPRPPDALAFWLRYSA